MREIAYLVVVCVLAGALARVAECAFDADARKESRTRHAAAGLAYAGVALVASSLFMYGSRAFDPVHPVHVEPEVPAKQFMRTGPEGLKSTQELREAMIRNVTRSEPPAIKK